MRCWASGRLRKIRRRREENAPPFARNRSAKRRPLKLSRVKGAATRHQDECGRLDPLVNGHSERSACITSTRAARAAGSDEATTAAVSSTNAERTTGKGPGIFTSKK